MYDIFYCGRDGSIYSVLELSIRIHVLPWPRKMLGVTINVSGRVEPREYNQHRYLTAHCSKSYRFPFAWKIKSAGDIQKSDQ